MTTLLLIDSSARSLSSDNTVHGSHTRRLTQRFVAKWLERYPSSTIIRRDVGMQAPAPVSQSWIQAAFTPERAREAWMKDILQSSDELVDEIIRADLIIAGVPMYNFGPPAQFKAYVDNIVRVGRTFGFDRSRDGLPYWPLLEKYRKRLIVCSSRGDYGYDPGNRIEAMNHVEPWIRVAFAYIGITDVHSVAIEYDEFADDRLVASIAAAEQSVDNLVLKLASSNA